MEERKIINVRDDTVNEKGENQIIVFENGTPVLLAERGTKKLLRIHRELNKTFQKLENITTEAGNIYLHWTIKPKNARKEYMLYVGNISDCFA